MTHEGLSHFYVAFQPTTGQKVSVEVFRGVWDAGLEESFRVEGPERERLAGYVGVAPILISGFTQHAEPFWIRPFYEMGSVQAVLNSQGPINFDIAVGIINRIGEVVHRSHLVDVIHGDIKPSYVLLRGDGSPQIAGFGLTKTMAKSGYSSQSKIAFLSSPYASPESVAGAELTRASDVYGLALTLWSMVTGSVPYAYLGTQSNLEIVRAYVLNEPVGKFPDPLPPQVTEVLQRALHKDPTQRQQSVRNFLDELLQAVSASRPQASVAGGYTPVMAQSSFQSKSLVKSLRIAVSVMSLVVLGLTGYLVAPIIKGALFGSSDSSTKTEASPLDNEELTDQTIEGYSAALSPDVSQNNSFDALTTKKESDTTVATSKSTVPNTTKKEETTSTTKKTETTAKKTTPPTTARRTTTSTTIKIDLKEPTKTTPTTAKPTTTAPLYTLQPGCAAIHIPYLIGMNEAEAKVALESVGLKAGTNDWEFSSSRTVTATKPVAGHCMPSGSHVVLNP